MFISVIRSEISSPGDGSMQKMWKSRDHTDTFNPNTILLSEKFRWITKKISSVYNDGIPILYQTLTIRNSFTERLTEQGVTKVFFFI
jgi:hypothetical protein